MAEKTAKSKHKASVEPPEQPDYFNISGEKISIRNKYEVDLINIPSLDPEKYIREGKPILLPSSNYEKQRKEI